MNTQNSNISSDDELNSLGECLEALANCSHNKGTVNVCCLLCGGTGSVVHRYGPTEDEHEYADCPNCEGAAERRHAELCGCLEKFGKATIHEAILGEESDYPDLCQVLKGMPDHEVGAPPPPPPEVQNQSLARLRAWSAMNTHRVTPKLLEIFLLHLLDRGMIQCQAREAGRVVFAATGAKEEVSRFIKSNPQFSAYFDDETVKHLRSFAYRKLYIELIPFAWPGSWIATTTLQLGPLCNSGRRFIHSWEELDE
jgi:hypothetical protein